MRYEIWDGEVWPVAETMFDTDNAVLVLLSLGMPIVNRYGRWFDRI